MYTTIAPLISWSARCPASPRSLSAFQLVSLPPFGSYPAAFCEAASRQKLCRAPRSDELHYSADKLTSRLDSRRRADKLPGEAGQRADKL
jgi:hypothetical protein